MKAIVVKYTSEGVVEKEVNLPVGSNVRGMRFKKGSISFDLKDVQEIASFARYDRISNFIENLRHCETKD